MAFVTARPLFSCLVLLDLNGTLVYRSLVPLPDVRCAFKGRNGKYVYPRRGANELVEGLSVRGFTVCVLSSMAERNVDEAIDRTMSEGARGALAARLSGDRYNRPDPHGVAAHDTVRDMDAVWARFPDFSARNTVLVDNEARKFEKAPRCGVVIPEMGAAERSYGGVSVLTNLLAYFGVMADAAPIDVQDWMEAHPLDLGNEVAEVTTTSWTDTTALEVEASIVRMARMSIGAPNMNTNTSPSHPNFLSPTAAPRGVGVGGSRSSPGGSASGSPDTRGLSVHFVCIEDGRFTFYSQRGMIFVRGPVNVPFRLDARMDYHRLLDSAKEAGVELEITMGASPSPHGVVQSPVTTTMTSPNPNYPNPSPNANVHLSGIALSPLSNARRLTDARPLANALFARLVPASVTIAIPSPLAKDPETIET